MDDSEINWPLVARHLAGDCSPDEEEQLRRWMAEDPARARMVEGMARVWRAAAHRAPPDPRAVEASWARIEGRIRDASAAPFARPIAAPARRRRPAIWLGAGALAAATLVAVVLTTGDGARDGGAGGDSAPAALRVETTAPGERRSLDLPDGSRVLLGASSALHVAPGYGDGARRVRLEGAGWFTVRHDPRAPFVVEAGATIVEDLGTEFAVDAYPGAASQRVVVASGTVAVRRAGAPARDPGTLLRARQAGIVAASDGAVTVLRDADLEPMLAWTEGRLVFDDTSLREVAAALERWYGVRVHLADEALADRRLTASFAGEPLTQVLDVISMSLGIRHERRDGEIVLSGSLRAGGEGEERRE
jgi:ferric-dicitrate binding protein FerR (iron transport regulator)